MNINFYADESCHLQDDGNDIMVLGCIQCPKEKKDDVFQDIRNLKLKHAMSSWNEVKWTKVSNSRIDFYTELIDYFFDNDDLTFRTVVANGKKSLDLDKYFNGDYDKWYYVMYYYLINKIIFPQNTYRIFIDIKDTLGQKRVKKLHDVLCNSQYDFSKKCIKDIHRINSKESEIMQLTDLLIGALSYYHRGLYQGLENKAKDILIKKITENIGLEKFVIGTRPSEEKFNIFIWNPRGI
jgi:hypothetical protein